MTRQKFGVDQFYIAYGIEYKDNIIIGTLLAFIQQKDVRGEVSKNEQSDRCCG